MVEEIEFDGAHREIVSKLAFAAQVARERNHSSAIHGEQNAKVLEFACDMGRRPDKREGEILSKENLKELRYNLAHLSVPAVRDFYERAYQDCRLIYNRIPSPRQIQTLVQIWKQLWKCH